MKNNKNSKINKSDKKPIDLGVSSKSLSKKGGYRVIKLIDAFELDIQKPKMIIEDILNERGNTLLSAEDNVGKSLMANQIGLCIATGTSFLGYHVPTPRKVLLIQHEMENGEQIDRLKKQSTLYKQLKSDLFGKNVMLHLIEDGENLAITDQLEVLNNTLLVHKEIEVVVFDNIGQSTNVEMTKPDAIRNELKRLKALCRYHSVAFLLVAHHVKVDWSKEMDLTKRQIQGGKPITDWADNVIQLHTSSMNPNLVLFKISKIRSIHNDDGESSKLLNQAVWFNRENNLLFSNRFTVSNWEGHFTAVEKHERELDFVKELNEYPQPFETNDALNVGEKFDVSPSTVKGYWLPKLVKWGWLKKEGHGKYSVNRETLDFLTSETLNS
ncbi:MAG: AAA family ATPase [Candidatus Brocadiales bacterium]|nr:AAA family ATPase [Candidatus Brocadiales bacterium]